LKGSDELSTFQLGSTDYTHVLFKVISVGQDWHTSVPNGFKAKVVPVGHSVIHPSVALVAPALLANAFPVQTVSKHDIAFKPKVYLPTPHI